MAPASATRTTGLPLKRKAVEAKGPGDKRPRTASNDVDGREGAGNYTSSTDGDESSEDESTGSPTALTPPTSISAGSTPASKPRPKNHRCPFPSCNKAYTRPVRLDEHIRSHTNTRPYVCPEPSCGKAYLRDSHLKHHVKSAHTSIRNYVCNWSGCSKSFHTGQRLGRHIAMHEGKEKFRCRVEECGMTFRKHGTLQRHTKSVHEGLKPYVCTSIVVPEKAPSEPLEVICNSGFDTAAKLKAHQTRMHSDKRFTCDVCTGGANSNSVAADDSTNPAEIWFETYSLLKSHVKTAHPPTCPQCSTILPSPSALSSHIELYHEMSLTERQSHMCPDPHCERGFTRKGNLVYHVKTVHEKRRDFVCGESDISGSKNIPIDWNTIQGCGSTFLTKGNLVGHFKTAHLDNRRTAKKVSKRRSGAKVSTAVPPTNQPSDLVHSLTGGDNEEQPLSCLEPLCFMVFYDSNALFTHLEVVHGIFSGESVGQEPHREEPLRSNEALDEEGLWNGSVGETMDEVDRIAERALDALREELQRELLPIDPMLA